MPTDQTGPLTAEEAPPKTSAIENELPSYRAISIRAVFSVVCGLMAAFSLADLTFLVFAVLAVILGLVAHRAIKRTPDVLTGRGLANTGITLGLIFGLGVLTYTAVQNFILARDASKFADMYAKVLKEGSFGDALLLRSDGETRKTKTAAEMEKDFDAMKARDRGLAEQRMAPLNNLRKALAPKDAHIHLVGIEDQGVDDGRTGRVGYFALALFEIEGPPSKSGSESKQFALAILKAMAKGRHYDWYVEDLVFPYMPKSYEAAAKPADDGHGHPH